MRLEWLPNILSSLRIVLAIMFPFTDSDLQILILCLALITEYSDGRLARKYNWVTATGQVLDPVADKFFALSVGLSFVILNKLSAAALMFLLTRDLIAGLGFIIIVFVFRKQCSVRDFRPNLIGKITTAFQYIVFLDLAVATTSHPWLILMAGTLSVISAIVYAFSFYLTFS